MARGRRPSRSSSRCSLQTNNKIDGVIAANDNIAGAVVATLKAKGLKPIPLSGQDATVQGVQNIISGWQTMTVYKYVPDEANATAAAAIALFKGQEAEGQRKEQGEAGISSSPRTRSPRRTTRVLFRDKFLKRSDVCSGEYKQYCK